jgi:tripartite-type tricarboxylate transporter receptor subunit TctC
MRKRLLFATAVVCLTLVSGAAIAAAPFYQNKVVRITVGFSAGGGFDLWARLIARHLGKHIPGNPTVVVENVTGAGGLIQVNQLYKGTKPDGLTIGHINGGLILAQLVGQPGYEFDSMKFIYIGSSYKENDVYTFNKKSGITSADKWRTSPVPVKIGGLMPGNSLDNTDRVIKEILSFPTQIISGYKGSADIRIAVESGELAGGPTSFDSFWTTWKKSVDSGDMALVLQATAKPIKEIPDVPRIIDFAKTDEQKKFVQLVVHDANEYSRPFALPPGTPQDRVETVR